MFDFELTNAQLEDVRWYLEDYLQYPHEPAPSIAARIEADIKTLGMDLFRKVFQSDDDARDLWATLRQKLDETRIEISCCIAEATSIPWEFLCDPKTEATLALRAEAFVRTHTQASQPPKLPLAPMEDIRVLLVICRPGGVDDVPFRSVATHLIKGLAYETQSRIQLDVMRPATFERLTRVLYTAKKAGKPYHVVHFDGHGMYGQLSDCGAGLNGQDNAVCAVISGLRTGQHGYVIFEKPDHPSNMELVDGPTLGNLLVANDVPFLVLNACRSAHAEPAIEPQPNSSIHQQVRAIGSFAHEVMDAGVVGVVAMRYNVFVVTAAQFVADMYRTLVHGSSLGEAVSMGRKLLAAKPDRSIGFQSRSLQDWCVPIVYEALPIQLTPVSSEDSVPIVIRSGFSATEASVDQSLPRTPDIGFFGRDETLLALDRAFDSQQVVLLHAYAGSGKTTSVAEFARWYAYTGGINGPVLFTSFERYTPLPRVLDKFASAFGPLLEQNRIPWLTLDDSERRRRAIEVLRQIPVLWIWDNVEPIQGLTNADQTYTREERDDLSNFLRDLRGTKAKVLLTSRRDERQWLANLPCRIQVPPMPMLERIQLARALAERHGRRVTSFDNWLPLLRFTRGNPLAIVVLVGQTLLSNLESREEIEEFVARLEQGDAAIDDDEQAGRHNSLAASLRYGFDHAFTEGERRVLSFLALFQGYICVDVLDHMRQLSAPCELPELQSTTRESLTELLDRSVDVGLLTSLDRRYYAIHPAIPWFLKSLELSSASNGISDMRCPSGTIVDSATRAFVESMGDLGNHIHEQFMAGNRNMMKAVELEEANLLHARDLARKHGWWRQVICTMQGLRCLYRHEGRIAEWRRRVEEITPDFVNLPGDAPMPGREDGWANVTEYRADLALAARQWDTAERLCGIALDMAWQRANEIIGANCTPECDPATDLELSGGDEWGRLALRSICIALNQIAEVQSMQNKVECVASLEKSWKIANVIGDCQLASECSFMLGHAYKNIPSVRDLGLAERSYRQSLALLEDENRIGRARRLAQLGSVARGRFLDGSREDRPTDELQGYLNAALDSYYEALVEFPQDAVDELSTLHHQVGLIYGHGNNRQKALDHFREAIRLGEAIGNHYLAALSRYNVAFDLAQLNRLSDAREYAIAALRGFNQFGGNAADIARTQELLAQIDSAPG